MIERLDQQGVNDANIISRIVIQIVCRVSLEYLMEDTFHIDTDSYENVCIEVYGRIKQKINSNEIMSCIWAPIYSFHNCEETSYEFFHKSHQEYMAAKYIIDSLGKNRTRSICDVIGEFVEGHLDDSQLKK